MALSASALAQKMWEENRTEQVLSREVNPKTGEVKEVRGVYPPNADSYLGLATAIVDHVTDDARVRFGGQRVAIASTPAVAGPMTVSGGRVD